MSDPDELLEEIRDKHSRIGLVSVAARLGLTLTAVAGLLYVNGEAFLAHSIAFGVAGLAVLSTLPWASWWDRRNLTTHVHYDVDERGENVVECLSGFVEGLRRSNYVWSILTEESHGNWKTNAGAGRSIERKSIGVRWKSPPRIATNVRVGCVSLSATTLYFFPDRLLVYGVRGVNAILYSDISIIASTTRFIEESSCPRDAIQLGTTWKFVNKNGSPDRRFANNYQLPIMQYDVLEMTSSSGLRLKFYISKAGHAISLATIFELGQELAAKLAGDGDGLSRATTRHGFRADAESPPLAVPAKLLAKAGVDAIRYRWLAFLPEWGVPIVWGLIFVGPVAAIMLMAAQGPTPAHWVFLYASLGFLACGVPVLVRDRRVMLDGIAQAESKEAMAIVLRELRARLKQAPRSVVDLPSLAADCGADVATVERVAERLYRRTADKVVADGVVTPEERAMLKLLARALSIAPARAVFLEADAAAERYRKAIDEVVADGVVTAEESRMLDDMRANLGIEGQSLAPGFVSDVVVETEAGQVRLDTWTP